MIFADVSDKVYTYCESCLNDAVDSLDEQLMEEGVNWDNHKKFAEMAPRVKATIKEAKKLIKEGKGAEANKKIDSVIAELEEFQKALMDYDDSLGEVMCGRWLEAGSFALRGMAAGILTLGIGTLVVSFKDNIDSIVGIIEIIKKEKNVSFKDFNTYRTRLVGACKRMISALKKAKPEVIDEANANKDGGDNSNPSGDTTKESVDPVDLQLDIFEAYESGNISEEDRDELLAMLDA